MPPAERTASAASRATGNGSAVWGRVGAGAGCTDAGAGLFGADVAVDTGRGVDAAGGSYRFWNSSRAVLSLLPPVAQISAPKPPPGWLVTRTVTV